MKFLKDLWQSLIQVLLRPGVFFDKLDLTAPLLKPLSFFIIIASFIMIIGNRVDALLFRTGLLSLYFIIKALLALIALIFITPAIIKLLFIGQGGYRGTFGVLCYSSAPAIFTVIPILGMIVAAVWQTIVMVIGFKRVHKFSTAIAALCFIITAIVFIAGFAGLNFLLFKDEIKAASSSIRTEISEEKIHKALILIQSAEKIRKMESGNYADCDSTADCISKLDLKGADLENCDYRVILDDKGSFCVEAKGASNWFITGDGRSPEKGLCH